MKGLLRPGYLLLLALVLLLTFGESALWAETIAGAQRQLSVQQIRMAESGGFFESIPPIAQKLSANSAAFMKAGNSWEDMQTAPEASRFANVETGAERFREAGRWKDPADYSPLPGDYVFFDWGGPLPLLFSLNLEKNCVILKKTKQEERDHEAYESAGLPL